MISDKPLQTASFFTNPSIHGDMTGFTSGCVICGAPLVYHEHARSMVCAVCGRTFDSNAECENGHYVCDSCHSDGLSMVRAVCLSSDSRDPIAIVQDLMRLPGIHMHGPEHHVMVGSALLTAYRNCGGGLDLGRALDAMAERGRQVPGGVCGLWGCCGAAVSCGMAYSIITGSTPLSGESWGRCNIMTSRCLEAIGSIGGPRCCKRDSFSALRAASRYIGETLGVGIETSMPMCRFHQSNPQCLGECCPYHRG